MSRCKYCGGLIDWIRTPKGRYMPVEYRPVLVMPGRGDEVFITDEGEAIRGKRALPAAVGGGNIAAYVPHWAVCPARPAGRDGRAGNPAGRTSLNTERRPQCGN